MVVAKGSEVAGGFLAAQGDALEALEPAEAVLDALNCDVLVVKPGRFQTKVPRRARGAQLMAFPSTMTG